MNSCAFWCSGFYTHWSDYTAAEASGLLQLWQQPDSALIKPDMLKVYSCRLCSSSCCSKATMLSDSPLLPTAKEDVMVCGLCFISGPGGRNLLLDWYCQRSTCSVRGHFPGAGRTPKNYFRARTGSWFFKSVVPTGDGTSGQKKRLKFRIVPHLLLLLMLKSQSGFL